MSSRGLSPRGPGPVPPRCAFCGKFPPEVERIVAGPRPDVAICEHCLAVCNEIIVEDGRERERQGWKDVPSPKTLRAELDRWVVGQAYAKKVLSVATHQHYKRRVLRRGGRREVEIDKSNILLIGPTGTGKTLLAATLARLLDVPFAIADATTLTDAGYVGEDVQSVVQKLLAAADNDVARAEEGIVFIDEIDKIARRDSLPSATHDVSGEAVQQGLLKLIEGSVASVPVRRTGRHGQPDMVQLDTRHILFIGGGAFTGLDRIVRSRLGTGGIGFGAELTGVLPHDDETLRHVEPQDLIGFGIIPEFVGRFPVVAPLAALDEEALLAVLCEPRNALLKQFHKLVALDGCELEVTEQARRALVRRAIARGIGARGLRALLERILLDVMFELPGMPGVRRVVVDEDVVEGTGRPLYEEDPSAAPHALGG